MDRICLNEGWALREAPLHCGKEMSGWVAACPDGWHKHLTLPLDVRMPLMEAGLIKDPALADYYADSQWIEQRSWWFKKVFHHDAWEDYAAIELVLESIDAHADIFLNGAYLGHHASTHFPFRHEISPYVVQGENTLLVRLTAGLEQVSDRDLAEIDFAVSTEAGNGCPERGDPRRAFVRKPAYVFGWDWCPRVGSVAITKNAFIEGHRAATIRHIGMETVEIDEKNARAKVRAELEIALFDITATADADVRLSLAIGGRTAACGQLPDILLRSGLNYVTLWLTVDAAQLWWPYGMGKQPLYEVTASVACRGITSAYPPFNFGLRQITMDTGREDENHRRFAFLVNGKRIFCKGGNWIPADTVYARITPERYDALVHEAAQAHFNMLRVWGGGLYERDEFYDACDRYGLLVWQDMMFACAAYPDHLSDMYDLIGRELDYQTRRLANRACLAVFCGNNENHVAMREWFREHVKLTAGRQYGLKTSNVQVPEYVRKNCPWIPYWNGSPYGGDTPNAYNAGDVHYWGECMMNPDMAKRIDPREFDKVTARFVSEYGYPGPYLKESIERYFDGAPVERNGKIWNLHNNTFEKLTVAAGIKKHFTEGELTLEAYLLYAGAVQSLMLEYSLESLRFKTFCGGGLFWMYNDCWGEVGWSIIDYYLVRKISFYGVRRAFAPVKLIMREQDGVITVVGCNDTATAVSFDLRYGYTRFDGKEDHAQMVPLTLPAYSRDIVVVFDKEGNDPAAGTWYAAPVKAAASTDTTACPDIYPALLRPFDSKVTVTPKAQLSFRETDAGIFIRITAETYCRCAYLDTPAEARLSDNYFSLLPGEIREIQVDGSRDALPSLKFI